MAVVLDALWLNDAENPSDRMSFAYVGDSYRVAGQVGGGVEHGYASGRSRAYSTEDDITTVAFTAANVTAEQVDWLWSHRGRTVCFRDHLGRKVFATYYDVQVEVPTGGDELSQSQQQAPVSLTSTTFSEAV